MPKKHYKSQTWKRGRSGQGAFFYKKIQTRLVMGLVLVFASTACQAYYRLRNPVTMEGRSPEFLEYKEVFLVYYDPLIPKERLEASLRRGYEEWKFLKKSFFPQAEKQIYVIVYPSQASYNRGARNLPESLARFDRSTNRMYLAVEAKRPAWRHELVHAMLDGMDGLRPSNQRVQEGLAWFLQFQKFSGTVDCQAPQKSRPLPLRSILQQIRREAPPPLEEFFGSRRHSLKDLRFFVRSAYYMQFIWSKGALQKSLRYYLKHRYSHFEYELTRGDYIRLKKLYAEFNRWLRSPAPLRGERGC